MLKKLKSRFVEKYSGNHVQEIRHAHLKRDCITNRTYIYQVRFTIHTKIRLRSTHVRVFFVSDSAKSKYTPSCL